MRWSGLLLLVLLFLLPGCPSLFGSSGPALPPVMPPNFFLGIRVLEATDPPIDYIIKVERSGNVSYESTTRVPRHRRHEGELELNESQMVKLYDAVLSAGYDRLASEYTAAEGATNRRENGERIFYVVAGDLDKRVDAEYAAVPELDELQKAILAEMPDYVLSGEGAPGEVRDRPEAFVADKHTKLFHHPDCERVNAIAPGDRDAYSNEYDALNFGYNPCEICRPLETRK